MAVSKTDRVSSAPTVRLCPGLTLIALLLYATVASAIDRLDLHIGAIDHPGWSVSDASLRLSLRKDGRVDLAIRATDLKLSGRHFFARLDLRCAGVVWDHQGVDCLSGRIVATDPAGARLRGTLSFRYRFAPQRYSISLENLRIAGGVGSVTLDGDDQDWWLSVGVDGLRFDQFSPLIQAFYLPISDYTDQAGHVDISASVAAVDGAIERVRLDWHAHEVSFNGPNVAQDVDAQSYSRWRRTPKGWSARGLVRLSDGAVYIQPGFSVGGLAPGFTVEIANKPVTIFYDAVHDESNGLAAFIKIKHPDVLTMEASVFDPPADLPSAKINMQTNELGLAYETYFQPLLLDTGLSALDAKGAVRARLNITQGALIDLSVLVDGVSMADQQGRFGLRGVNGNFHLTSRAQPVRSRLSWEGARLYRLETRPGELVLESAGGRLTLVRNIRIPILDGELIVESLRADRMGSDDFSLHMDVDLTPMSLSDLCRALDWPDMAGEISGKVSDLTYSKGLLEVHGKLGISAFDGDIEVVDLTIRDMFGLIPRFAADIHIDNLDLEELTRTFSFGKIEGILSGHIRRLKLEDWQPVYFEAEFASEDHGISRNRISQRAIDNLTSIGGGATTGAISRTFLRFFDDFSYSRLGLKCRLSNGVCQMDGVEPTGDGGYYIVKHGLIPPWLDVKGYNREVDWADLVRRLQAISQSEGPVVE